MPISQLPAATTFAHDDIDNAVIAHRAKINEVITELNRVSVSPTPTPVVIIPVTQAILDALLTVQPGQAAILRGTTSDATIIRA